MFTVHRFNFLFEWKDTNLRTSSIYSSVEISSVQFSSVQLVGYERTFTGTTHITDEVHITIETRTPTV